MTKYLDELDPTRPSKNSYVIDTVEDLKNIKRALKASFVGFQGPVVVWAAQGGDLSTPTHIRLTLPTVSLGDEHTHIEITDQTLVVFQSPVESARGVRLELNGMGLFNVMDSQGQPLEAGAIRKDGVHMLRCVGSTWFLLGYVNAPERLLPPPSQARAAQLLGSDGARYTWTDPPKGLPDEQGHAGHYLTVGVGDAPVWSELPPPPQELPPVMGQEGKALMVIKAPEGGLRVGWESYGGELPPLEGQVGKALYVIEDPKSQALGTAWEAVPESLPPLDGQKGKVLQVAEDESRADWTAMGEELPPLAGHAGGVLSVIQTARGQLGVAWRALPPSELPEIAPNSHGETLQVDADNRPVWLPPARELPPMVGQTNKVLTVVMEGSPPRDTAVWMTPPPVGGLPSLQDHKGQVLTVIEDSESSELRMAWQGLPPAGDLPSPAGQEGAVLRVRASVPVWDEVRELPAYEREDAGKYLRLRRNKDGDSPILDWQRVKDELPDFTATDVGKVLSVDGSGQLTWAAPAPAPEPEPEPEPEPTYPEAWQDYRLYTPDRLPADGIAAPPGARFVGVALWGRGGLADPEQGHGGGGAGFCFQVFRIDQPGQRIGTLIYEEQFGAMALLDQQEEIVMQAGVGGDATPEAPGVGGTAAIKSDKQGPLGITATGGAGGRGVARKVPNTSKRLICGGGGGGAGSFYGDGGDGGDASAGSAEGDLTQFLATGGGGGGFGGAGGHSKLGGAAPGGGGACHRALSSALAGGGEAPEIWQANPSMRFPGLGGGGGGGSGSAGSPGRVQWDQDMLSLGGQGGSGLDGEGGMGASDRQSACDGVTYLGSSADDLRALANLCLGGGGGGGGNQDFGDGGNGGPGGGGGGACAHTWGGRGGSGGLGGGGGGAALTPSTPGYPGGNSLFGGGGGGSVGTAPTAPGQCLLGGGGQGGHGGSAYPAADAAVLVLW